MTGRAVIDGYMTRSLVTLSPDMEITRAVALLIARDISGAPVVDATQSLVGILTAKDCLRAMLHASYHQELGDVVASYMAQDVETLEAGLDVVSAAKRFLESDHRRFPVTRDGALVGILTRMDLLRAFQREGEGR